MNFISGLGISYRNLVLNCRIVAPYRPDWASKIGQKTSGITARQRIIERATAKIDRTKWSDLKSQKTEKEPKTVKVKNPAINTFHDVSFILIDFEAIENQVCEFPAIHYKNGEILSIFHSYCRAPPITEKRWAGFYENFLGLSLNFYRNQPLFGTVEWHFCKWAKYNKLFFEDEEGKFSLNKNVAIVTQGDGDFAFLHSSLRASKINRNLRPCYDEFYDLDLLWTLAEKGPLPGSPRMHNMAMLCQEEVISDAHSGIHDTLQLSVVFDHLRRDLTEKGRQAVISGAKRTYKDNNSDSIRYRNERIREKLRTQRKLI